VRVAAGAQPASLEDAHALLRRGEAAQAVALLKHLADSRRGDIDVLFALGTAHGMLNQDAEAEAAFREAARLRPDLRDAHLNVALSLLYQGRPREAIAPLVAARRIAPADPAVADQLMTVVLGILQDEAAGPQATPRFAPLPAQPLVSVVVPTRDRPFLLRDALQSVARQSYGNWEVIVADDGGGDAAAVARTLEPHAAARVKVVRTEGGKGAARARNLAVAAARGEILAFLDDDDLYLPEHLAELVLAVAPSGAPVAYTESAAVEERLDEGRRVEIRRASALPYRYSRSLLLVRNMIPTACWGMRRECFLRWGGFDEGLACAEDWDLLLRYSSHTPFLRIARTTAEVRVRAGAPDSVTQRVPLQPTCELLYRRYPAGTSELIALGREVYAASIA
jgi:hypothetical protein